jgi:transposase-like protein
MSWRPKKLTAKQREERRLEAVQLLRTTDLSQAAIARIVGVSRTAVTKWKQQIKQRRHGLAGLKNRPAIWPSPATHSPAVASSVAPVEARRPSFRI